MNPFKNTSSWWSNLVSATWFRLTRKHKRIDSKFWPGAFILKERTGGKLTWKPVPDRRQDVARLEMLLAREKQISEELREKLETQQVDVLKRLYKALFGKEE